MRFFLNSETLTPNFLAQRQSSQEIWCIGLAAAVLYLASLNTGENITQANIADAAGVTEVTIRSRYKDLVNH
jgi:transcription initiation factor TFIIIB Brf1 subunit/transcription initiation factor TFIIB